MIKKIYSIYDTASKAYNTPFYLDNEEMAKREFTELCNDASYSIAQFPQDFTLFEIGTYDDSTAKISMHEAITSLGNGLGFVRPTPKKAENDLTSQAIKLNDNSENM